MEQYISAVDKAIDTHYNNERFENWTARKLERINKKITTSYSNYTYKKQATDEDGYSMNFSKYQYYNIISLLN